MVFCTYPQVHVVRLYLLSRKKRTSETLCLLPDVHFELPDDHLAYRMITFDYRMITFAYRMITQLTVETLCLPDVHFELPDVHLNHTVTKKNVR
jgi:hypothetical protein